MRILTGDEIVQQLTSIDAYRAASGEHGDTVTTAALAKSGAALAVAAITNFGANDPVLINGSGGPELNEISAAPAGLAIALKRKALFAQAAGARVLEMAQVALGHIAEDSAEISGTNPANAVTAATSRVPIAYIAGGGELSFRFGLLGFNIENIQLAFGITEDVEGMGTVADPFQGSINASNVGTFGPLCFRGRGVRPDGYIVELDMLGVTITGSPTINYSGKTGRSIPLEGRARAHAIRVFK